MLVVPFNTHVLTYSQPRTLELFHTLGIIDDIQRLAHPMKTLRAYKLPGGTVPVKSWDMFDKDEMSRWPDRPYVRIY